MGACRVGVLAVGFDCLSPSLSLYPPLLGPIQRDAYGPQIGTDGTGRPFYWQPQTPGAFQGPDITIQPQINQYGFGQSADQYGRVIQPEMAQDQRSSRGIGRNLSFGIDTGLENE